MSDRDAITAAAPGAPADRLFAGRYRLVGRRGTGLDVALFEAVDVIDDQTVAVKIVHPDVCAQPGFAALFAETMPRVASLRHPNLTDVREHGTTTWNDVTVQFVVTENLTGGSLRDVRDRGRTLTPSQAVVVGLDVCRGLDIAHRAGLVHGDIRPTTLMFGADGRLRIADLGLGRLVADDQWRHPEQLSIDRAKYASPEQARAQEATAKSDVYALCLCLLEAVTGQLPFVGDSTVATLSNRLDKLMPVSADLGPLAAVLERGGRPDPADRYTAAELGRALVQAAEKLPRPSPIALVSGGLFDDGALRSSAVATTAAPVVSPSIVATEPSIADASAVLETSPPVPLPAPVPTSVPTSTPTSRLGVVGPGAEPASAPPVTPQPPTPPPTPTPPPPPPPPPPPTPPPPSPGADGLVAADEVDVEPLESRGRRRLVVVALVVLLALAAGGVLAWFVGRTVSHTVPDLVGVEQGEALNMVSEFAWDVTVVEEFSEDVALGAVISTDPPAGTSVAEGGELSLVVSKGPAPRALPDIAGSTVDAATAQLTELGLVLQVEQEVADETVPAGVIVSWSVPSQPGLVAGDTVLPGTLVSAVVSTGPAPRVVPDLTGLTLADATAQLEGLGLTVTALADEFSSSVAAGAVARQDPAPGTSLARGSSVALAISKGPDVVAVPPVANLTPDQAAQTLAAAGLSVGAIGGDPAGVVIGASVQGVALAGGEIFPRGTAVDLVFGVPAG